MKKIIQYIGIIFGAVFLLISCKSDVEMTTMSQKGECVLMATATEAEINYENYKKVAVQFAWQTPLWYSNDASRNSVSNTLPAYLQTSTDPSFSSFVEVETNGQSMTLTEGNLNAMAKKLSMEIGKKAPIYFRIRCGNLDIVSNVCSVTVTPIYISMTTMNVLSKDKLQTISKLYSPTENNIYTGYVNVSAGANCWFEEADFTLWGNVKTEDSAFKITSGNSYNCWFPQHEGDYYVVVNTNLDKAYWSAAHIYEMKVNGTNMVYYNNAKSWILLTELNGSASFAFTASARQYDQKFPTDDGEEDNPVMTYTFGAKDNKLIKDSKEEATVTGTGVYTITVSTNKEGEFTYKIEAGDQTPKEDLFPHPTELKIYEKYYAENPSEAKELATLTMTNGVYKGNLDVTEGWMNFYLVDKENNIFYGCPAEDGHGSELVKGPDCWNLWIPNSQTGVYEIIVDLDHKRWTSTRIGDLPDTGEKFPHPTELKIYEKYYEENPSEAKELATLTGTNGVYKGNLNVTVGWMNFYVVDKENDIYYGCPQSEGRGAELAKAPDCWNLWIPSEQTGVYEITVDLDQKIWSLTRIGDFPTIFPAELKVYQTGIDSSVLMGTLSQSEEGKYSGTVTTTIAWQKFQVIDATQTTWVWYGAGEGNNTLKVGGGDLWTGESIGDYTIDVDLKNMTWSATKKTE